MKKEFEIKGRLEVPQDITAGEFLEKFIGFIESENWHYGGGIREIRDGYYIKPDGTKGKKVAEKSKR